MRIAVVGAGAVGGYVAAKLFQAGYDVNVVEVGEHLSRIHESGLQINMPAGEFHVQPHAFSDTADIGLVDLVILSVQSQDTSRIAGQLRPLIGPRTVVMPLQNNVDNPDKLAEAIGEEHVLAAAIFIASSRPRPGVIQLLAEQVKISLGERSGQVSPRVRELAALFETAGIPCTATDQIRKEMWRKFTFVVGFYLTAPLRCAAADFLAMAETRSLHDRLIREVAAVAGGQGIDLRESDLEQVLEDTRYYGGYIPSAVAEIDEGRADEAEHMLRTVIRLGQSCGIATPDAEAVLAFTRFFNQRNKRQIQGGEAPGD